jgi:hypothetical protein
MPNKPLINSSIIIPFRGSGLRNKLLFKVLNFLSSSFSCEILVAEHGPKQTLSETFLESDFNTKYYFLQSEEQDLFDRTGTLNFLIEKSCRDVVVNHDSECLVTKEAYIHAENLILNNDFDAVLPYSGKGFNVSHGFDINNIEREHIQYLKWVQARGGIVFVDRSHYISAGLENPKIKSWGFEDFERMSRFSKLGYRICSKKLGETSSFPYESVCIEDEFLLSQDLYHFDHDQERHENSSKNPHAENNKFIAETIAEMSKPELLQEIESWKRKESLPQIMA